MTKVTAQMSVSLDGCYAGPRFTPETGVGAKPRVNGVAKQLRRTARDLGQRRHTGRDHRRSRGHRLHYREAEAFIQRWVNERCRAREQSGQILLRHVAQVLHPGRRASQARHRLTLRPSRRPRQH